MHQTWPWLSLEGHLEGDLWPVPAASHQLKPGLSGHHLVQVLQHGITCDGEGAVRGCLVRSVQALHKYRAVVRRDT